VDGGKVEMARTCTICSHPERLEIDKQLLRGDSIAGISRNFAVSEDSLSRHRDKHLREAISDVIGAMRAAREEALAQIRSAELETIKEEVVAEARETTAARLEAAASYLDQLAILRQKAADILETASEAGDLKTALMGIKEARACIEVLARIEGKLSDSPQINLQQVNIYSSPEWDAVGLLLARILEPYPDLRAEVATGLQALQEGQDGA